jgi:adenosylhomocysteine nucleosidase
VTGPVIGVLAAMDEEVRRLREGLSDARIQRTGRRDYLQGTIAGHPVVVAFSRWGKSAAASTTTTMIERFGADRVIFTGVAGAADPALGIGDVVVASSLVHHDLDARPIIGRFEVPLLDIVEIPTDPELQRLAREAGEAVLLQDLATMIGAEERERFGIDSPRVHSGLVGSGDRFMADAAEVAALRNDLPGLLAVEMEGAAAAQVCYEHDVPMAVLRTISDRADHAAPIDFKGFVEDVASRYAERLIHRMLERI